MFVRRELIIELTIVVALGLCAGSCCERRTSGEPGWQLDASNTGLAAVGLSCDDLAVYEGPSEPAAGTTLRELRITTALDLSAGNITIERCCIQPTAVGQGMPILTTTDYNQAPYPPASTMVSVRDCDIDGSLIHGEHTMVDGYDEYNKPVAFTCAFLGIGEIERCNIHDVGSGIAIYNTGDHLNAVVEGNYVHDLRAWGDPSTTGSHNESFTIRDFVVTSAHPHRSATVRNNRFESFSGNDTGAFFIQTNGDIDHVLVEGNLLASNGYQLILESRYDHVYGTSMKSRNNRFSGTGFGTGYVEPAGLTYGWAVWKENYIDDPAAPDHKGAVVEDPSP